MPGVCAVNLMAVITVLVAVGMAAVAALAVPDMSAADIAVVNLLALIYVEMRERR